MTPRFGHLSPIAPALSGNGLAMRVSLFTEALTRHGSVDVATLDAGPAGSAAPPGARVHVIAAPDDEDAQLRLIGRMPAGPGTQALGALGRPFASAALGAPVFDRVARLAAENHWRGLVLSRAYMAPALAALSPSCSGAPVLLDLDDDDAALLRARAGLARAAGDGDAAAWLDAEADAFDAAIRAAAARVQAFTAASDAVRQAIDARLAPGRIVTVPNAMPPVAPASAGPRDGLIFVGNLSYEPNIDGLGWFVREVWPRIRATAGEVRLRVCGSRPGPSVTRLCEAPGIALHADPADLRDLYARSAVAVVPLRLGSGTRIKILEAAAYGLPVAATGTAAEGLDPAIVAEIAVEGDEAKSLAHRCAVLLADPDAAERQARRLHALVAPRHDRQAVVRGLADLMGEVFR